MQIILQMAEITYYVSSRMLNHPNSLHLSMQRMSLDQQLWALTAGALVLYCCYMPYKFGVPVIISNTLSQKMCQLWHAAVSTSMDYFW